MKKANKTQSLKLLNYFIVFEVIFLIIYFLVMPHPLTNLISHLFSLTIGAFALSVWPLLFFDLKNQPLDHDTSLVYLIGGILFAVFSLSSLDFNYFSNLITQQNNVSFSSSLDTLLGQLMFLFIFLTSLYALLLYINFKLRQIKNPWHLSGIYFFG